MEAQAQCFMRAGTVFSASHVAHLMMFMAVGKYAGGRPTTYWDSSELVSDTLLSPLLSRVPSGSLCKNIYSPHSL